MKLILRGCVLLCLVLLPVMTRADERSGFSVETRDDRIVVTGAALEFAIKTKGYVSGIAANSLVDKKTGFRDPGFGLVIIDWLLEPGSDEAYRDQLTGERAELKYETGNMYHGNRAKRSIEGPQICTGAKALSPEIIHGKDFVAVKQSFAYRTAAPGKRTGSLWEQTLVFPAGKRWFLAADRFTVKNDSDAMFFRMDLPGHIKHTNGDSFSEIYLSYHGRIPASEFSADFAPDAKFNYRRDAGAPPERFIRAIHLRDPATGNDGPWLAGMTLNPPDVSEAWCHQRGYVCMIQENGERPVRAGQSFGAAYLVGYFDDLDSMNAVYDAHRGQSGLSASSNSWKLTTTP